MSTAIYIVEDHPVLQRVLCEFFDMLPNISVCGSAATAREALMQLPLSRAKLVLIDVFLPDMSGIQLIDELQSHQPELRCLVYSAYGRAVYIQQALAAGACGYILKSDARELRTAIQEVIEGQIYLSPALLQKWPSLRRITSGA